MPLEFPEAVWGWSGVSGWARRGVGVSLEACDAISMTHKKSGNVQDIAAALKKTQARMFKLELQRTYIIMTVRKIQQSKVEQDRILLINIYIFQCFVNVYIQKILSQRGHIMTQTNIFSSSV